MMFSLEKEMKKECEDDLVLDKPDENNLQGFKTFEDNVVQWYNTAFWKLVTAMVKYRRMIMVI